MQWMVLINGIPEKGPNRPNFPSESEYENFTFDTLEEAETVYGYARGIAGVNADVALVQVVKQEKGLFSSYR